MNVVIGQLTVQVAICISGIFLYFLPFLYGQ